LAAQAYVSDEHKKPVIDDLVEDTKIADAHPKGAPLTFERLTTEWAGIFGQ
jgi:hypothetical protein